MLKEKKYIQTFPRATLDMKEDNLQNSDGQFDALHIYLYQRVLQLDYLEILTVISDRDDCDINGMKPKTVFLTTDYLHIVFSVYLHMKCNQRSHI